MFKVDLTIENTMSEISWIPVCSVSQASRMLPPESIPLLRASYTGADQAIISHRWYGEVVQDKYSDICCCFVL